MYPYDHSEMKAVPLCAAFEQGAFSACDGRCAPQCVLLPAEDGRYAVRVRIAAQQDVQEALLFENRRRLVWRGSLAAGETREIEALCAVHPYLPDGSEQTVESRGVELALIAPGARMADVQLAPANVPALLLMGDSTVTDQTALSPYAPGATYCGWGQIMPAYLGMEACVMNFARSGLTVETCRQQGLYELLLAQLRPGDTVLMQFGHNDQKRPHLQADGGYADALRAFIDELRARGAKPAVVTPLARNSWWNEREYNDLLRAFAASALRVAQEKGVPSIDLHGFMMDVITAQGREAVKPLFHVGDYTHTNDFGAYLAAGYVAAELGRQGLLHTQALPAWPPHGPYDVPANDQGDEALPPTGLEALYLRYETEDGDAPLTRADALELVCRTCGLFILNERTALPADVPEDAPYAENVRCALQSRLLDADMLKGGCFYPMQAATQREFMRMLSRGYAMRRGAVDCAQAQDRTIARREAAAICRRTQI